jgi:hypothetical protein
LFVLDGPSKMQLKGISVKQAKTNQPCKKSKLETIQNANPMTAQALNYII